ncbi:unnamed protein product [Adineta steineri]|uniref:Uncharacterized protein n=1 Tax=Adineta steineri TaxID=433720 RepID=A0A814WGX8_9BILA|nr:unnamed protein product [Adineta steineri]CAF1202118.1 unnamed protein product [Adineta steineri]
MVIAQYHIHLFDVNYDILYFVGIQPSFGCIILNENFIEYASYFFYPVLAGLFPILIASSLSLLAYRNVRRIIRRQIPIVNVVDLIDK